MGSIVEVGALIDAAPLSRLQLIVLALGLACTVLEGYDTYAVSYIGPAVAHLWHVDKAELGIVFTAGLLGSALAFCLAGQVSDRFGRRRIVVLGTAAFGIATLASATSGAVSAFMAWRLIAGLALGAAFPNVVALCAEYAPARRRSVTITILCSGFPIGAALSGLIADEVLPTLGWRAVLVVGGVLPVVLAFMMGALLPESIRFLALRDSQGAALRRVLGRVAGHAALSAADRLVLREEQLSGRPWRELFREGRTLPTILIWIVMAMCGSAIALLTFWIPALFANAGLPLDAGIHFSVAMLVGGILGAYAVGWLMDRWGAFVVLILAYAAASALIGAAAVMLPGASLAIALAIGLTLNGGSAGAQAFLANLYPTAIRTTGIGWALGVSRAVGVAAPVIAGVMLKAAWSSRLTLLSVSAPALMCALALLAMSQSDYARRRVATGRPALRLAAKP